MSRGPKPDPYRAFTRRTFEEWSDRTFATYWRANRTLAELVEMGAMAEDHRRTVLAQRHPTQRHHQRVQICT